jgi:hypothetical protein
MVPAASSHRRRSHVASLAGGVGVTPAAVHSAWRRASTSADVSRAGAAEATVAGGGRALATGGGTTGGGAPRSHAESARAIKTRGARMRIIVPGKTASGNHPLREDE